jgi:hypothetical protein
MIFDHIPEQREKWLRVTDTTSRLVAHILTLHLQEYIANLAAPKLSVHVP